MGEARNRILQGLPPRGINQGQPMQVNVDLEKATQRACECGCVFFTAAIKVYTVSALLSPVGKELTAQVPVLICMECKKVLDLKAVEG